MTYFRTFNGTTVESDDGNDIHDCPECESDRTVVDWEDWNGYMNRCKDCDHEFRINY